MSSKMDTGKEAEEGMNTIPSEVGEGTYTTRVSHDAVFGEMSADGPNYRNVGLTRPMFTSKR